MSFLLVSKETFRRLRVIGTKSSLNYRYQQNRFMCAAAASGFPSYISLTLPALSPTMEEGKIVRWSKKVGDELKSGDAVAEIETDKATVDYQIVEDGYLAKIFVEAGGPSVKVGDVIGLMCEDQSSVAKLASITLADVKGVSSSSPVEPTPAATTITSTSTPPVNKDPVVSVSSPASSGTRVFASPLARKTANEAGIQLNSLAGSGSGPNGRIIHSDVTAFLALGTKPSTSTKPSLPTTKPPAVVPPPTPSAKLFTDIPVDAERIAFGHANVQSKREVPHYYLNVEIDVSEILKLQDTLNSTMKESDAKVSVNDFIIRASAKAVTHVPSANSAWMGTFIRQYSTCDFNITLATTDPKTKASNIVSTLISDVQLKGLSSIAKEVAAAGSSSTTTSSSSVGTFSITNFGALGIKNYAPIIRQPQAISMGVGSIRRAIIPGSISKDGGKSEFKVVNFLPITISCDHRVVDGAVSAQWLQKFKSYMENPMSLLL